jgi:ABC-type bacteriocin/lantibiotic exporter with double-glycine peptidase domain
LTYSSRHSFNIFRGVLAGGRINDRRRIARDSRATNRKEAPQLDRHLVWSYLRQNLVPILWLTLLSLAIMGLELGAPLLTKKLIDSATTTASDALFHWIGAALLLIVFGAGILGVFKSVSEERLRMRVGFRVRARFLRHVMRLGWNEYCQLPQADLARRIRDDSSVASRLVPDTIVTGLQATLKLILIFGVLYWYQPVMTLSLIGYVTMMLVGYRLMMSRTKRVQIAMSDDATRLDGRLLEILRGMRTLKEFDRERQTRREYLTSYNLMARKSVYVALIQSILDTTWHEFYAFCQVGVVWVGVIYVRRGSATIGDVVLFQMYGALLFPPIWQLISALQSAQKNMISAGRVAEVMNLPTESSRRPTGELELKQVDTLDLRNVSVSYGSQESILQDVSFTVRRGEFVALIGPSGAGKSTVLDLIQRFRLPTSGQLLINDRPIDAFSFSSYRSRVLALHQQPFVFSGTIEDNIVMGMPRDPERIIESARAARALDFIEELRHGFHTAVGEYGQSLSVGQFQRLCLARVLYHDPDVILLDEPTASLDQINQRLIISTLSELRGKKTVILVTHHIPSAARADRLILLERGRLADAGSHEELEQRSALYRELAFAHEPGRNGESPKENE